VTAAESRQRNRPILFVSHSLGGIVVKDVSNPEHLHPPSFRVAHGRLPRSDTD
jgi:hypothetical protein